MKKILFISYDLPPYLSPQSIQTGRFLQGLKDQYDVHILSADSAAEPDHSLYPNVFCGIPACNILRVPHSVSPIINYAKNRFFSSFYQRPDVFRGWAQKAYKECLKTYADIQFDVILTFSFPLSLNLLGQRLQKHYGCKWVAHQSDPWADNPFMHFSSRTNRLNSRLEAVAYQAADQLIFTCEEAANFYQKKYPQLQSKIHFINHSFDADLFPSPVPSAERTIKTIRYIGGFYGDRTAAPLISALRLLPESTLAKLKFEIVGANIKTKLLVQRANLPTDLLSVRGRVSYQESLDLMVGSDALLIIDAPLAANNVFFPSKLVDYIGSKRPILGISSAPGPTERILRSLSYHCYRHDQVQDIIKIFEDISRNQYAPTTKNIQSYAKETNVRKLQEIIECV